jgi:glycosyltransferase involved in cell wall biosynthesis
MRFAYLSCDFGVPVAGDRGSSVHVQETTSALQLLGHEVRVFSPRAEATGGALGRREVVPVPFDGLTETVVSSLERDRPGEPRLARELRSILYSEFVQTTLRPALASFRPDAIYERYALFSYGGLSLAAELGVPLLLEVNAPLKIEQARHRGLVLEHTAAELERLVVTGADAVLVVSNALADYVQGLGASPLRVTVLPNAVDPDRFHPAVSGGAARKRYGLGDNWVVGFVGSLKPWHDLDTVLAAAELLAAKKDRIHVLVVGDGPRSPELEAQASVRLLCTGAVERREVPGLMAAMDVVVVPYAGEDDAYFSPLKLYEAMAMGKPVVGADVGQVAEVLARDSCGLLYRPGDSRDLADAIRRVLRMPDRGASLGETGARAIAGRTWKENARRIAALAESLATMPRAS